MSGSEEDENRPELTRADFDDPKFHLKKRLGPPSKKRELGDLSGNMIYLCDKPSGVEGGFIALSLNDPGLVYHYCMTTNSHVVGDTASAAFMLANPNWRKSRLEEYLNSIKPGLVDELKGNHPISAINRIANSRSNVLMVKMDNEITGEAKGVTVQNARTGPPINRLKTISSMGQSVENSPFIPKAIKERGFLRWSRKSSVAEANASAVREMAATKIWAMRGFLGQRCDIVEGTFSAAKELPKHCIVVDWEPGLKDIADTVSAPGSDDAVAVDPKQSLEFEDRKYSLESMPIEDFGKAAITFLEQGDTDALGSRMQNSPTIQTPAGVRRLFGIDKGKCYDPTKSVIRSVKSDFSFRTPYPNVFIRMLANTPGIGKFFKRFKNYALLQGTPLTERMKGVYLLAALRGHLTVDEKDAIAGAFEKSDRSDHDKGFAKQLREYPISILKQFPDIAVELYNQRDPQVEPVEKFDDIPTEDYAELATNFDMKYVKLLISQYSNETETKTGLEGMLTIMEDTDKRLFTEPGLFKELVKHPPQHLELIENLERLSAREVHSHSKKQSVIYQHIRVKTPDRNPWRIEKSGDFYILRIDHRVGDLKTITENFIGVLGENQAIQLMGGAVSPNGCRVSKKDFEMLMTNVTEEVVYKTRLAPKNAPKPVALRGRVSQSSADAGPPYDVNGEPPVVVHQKKVKPRETVTNVIKNLVKQKEKYKRK